MGEKRLSAIVTKLSLCLSQSQPSLLYRYVRVDNKMHAKLLMVDLLDGCGSVSNGRTKAGAVCLVLRPAGSVLCFSVISITSVLSAESSKYLSRKASWLCHTVHLESVFANS